MQRCDVSQVLVGAVVCAVVHATRKTGHELLDGGYLHVPGDDVIANVPPRSCQDAEGFVLLCLESVAVCRGAQRIPRWGSICQARPDVHQVNCTLGLQWQAGGQDRSQ